MSAARPKHNMRLASSSEQGEAGISDEARYVSAEGSGSQVEDSCAPQIHAITARAHSSVAMYRPRSDVLKGLQIVVYVACEALVGPIVTGRC